MGEYTDNSISASDARKQRPAYDRLVRDWEAGAFDALICWDLDRLTRQPRQLEDWIDRAEQRGLLLVTANGEADLATDGGRMYARIKAAVARAEVERKGARQSRAQRQRAEHGRPPKGVRLTGYTIDGEVIPAEAAVVRRVFDAFTAGDTLKGIARRLEEDGVPTRRGGRWSSGSVSTMLRNARYAGRSVYNGQDVGAGEWPALVSEAQWEAVRARLHDPRRVTNHEDTARKHTGSGVYFCECGLRVKASSGWKGHPRYTCRNLCFYRSGEPIDDFVLQVVRGRLARPDLADLLPRRKDDGEAAALAAERAELRARLEVHEHDYDEGHIDGRRYAAAVAKVEARLADVRRRQAALTASDAFAALLESNDPVAAFDAAPLAIQQRIIDGLARITLHPAPRGSRTFQPDSITLEWR